MFVIDKLYQINNIRLHHSPETFRQKGLEQVLRYRDRFGSQTPIYLIIFDRRPESKSKPWDERISWEQDGDVTVLMC